jgi:hypothetical protein
VNSGEQHGQLRLELIERTFPGSGTGPDEELTMGEIGASGEDAKAAPQAVPDHGRTDLAPDGERHSRRDGGRVGEEPAPQRLAPGAATMTAQSLELTSLADAPDQADRRVRPLSRRALMIERPARVRIRARNPCLRARRRVLGW